MDVIYCSKQRTVNGLIIESTPKLKSMLYSASILISFLAIYPIEAYSDHLTESNCSSCHESTPVLQSNADELTGLQVQLCKNCHPGVEMASHPINFAPVRALPLDFPVNEIEGFTCSTCHEVHSGLSNLLREDTPLKEWCLKCHDINYFATMKDRGDSLIGIAHIDANMKPVYEPYDPYSMSCFACHDEQGNILGTSNHPIGMTYGHSTGLSNYRPITEIPLNIDLPRDQVSCISCHSGYSDNHGELNWSMEESGLCFQCHDV